MPRKIIDAEKLLKGVVDDKTLSGYTRSWKAYFKYADTLKKAMMGSTLYGWRQELIDSGKAAGTVNRSLSAIKTIARELYAHREIEREQYWDIQEVKPLPATALKERRRPNNRVRIEPEQMRAIVAAPPVSAENFLALRDRALMMTLATTGARISEVLAMKVNDIKELPGDKFVVTNIISKRHAETRSVPISAEAVSTIKDWLAFRPINSPYIFTGTTICMDTGGILYSDQPLHPSTALRRIKEYGALNNLPHIKSHDFRRFVGTQLVLKVNVVAAQKVLGHKSVATTIDNYVLEDFQPGTTDNLF